MEGPDALGDDDGGLMTKIWDDSPLAPNRVVRRLLLLAALGVTMW